MNDISKIVFPSKEEIYKLKEASKSLPRDDIIPISLWDGECYKMLFEMCSVYAKEEDLNPWDIFAVTIGKIHGFEVLP